MSRLRALSAWSNLGLAVQAREVSVEGKLGAVGVLEARAALLELREQLEDERAGEPHGVERIDAAHLDRFVLQRLDQHARDPSVGLRVRRADARLDVDAPAILQHCGDLQRCDDPFHHGIGDPSCEKNLPLSDGVRPAITLRRPATEVSAPSGAPLPPMSVRTQPGLSATTTTPLAPSVAASPFTSMLSAALLVA